MAPPKARPVPTKVPARAPPTATGSTNKKLAASSSSKKEDPPLAGWVAATQPCSRCDSKGIPCLIPHDAVKKMNKFLKQRFDICETEGADHLDHLRRPSSTTCQFCNGRNEKTKCDCPDYLEFLHKEDPYFEAKVASKRSKIPVNSSSIPIDSASIRNNSRIRPLTTVDSVTSPNDSLNNSFKRLEEKMATQHENIILRMDAQRDLLKEQNRLLAALLAATQKGQGKGKEKEKDRNKGKSKWRRETPEVESEEVEEVSDE
jgi:hypothetical protein